MTSIDQHNAEIHENRSYWEKKPLLRNEYARFYREIAASLNDLPPGPILECGSGIGNIKSVLPQAITSDLFDNPWLDRTENVYRLSYPDESLGAVVLFDVFHHLQYPGQALAELHRVLLPGGRVIIFEPAMGLLGRVALGLFHHEPLGLGKPITWLPPASFQADASGYYAAQGNAWRIFARADYAPMLQAWNHAHPIRYYPALPWVLSGGFRGPTLCSGSLEKMARLTDRIMNRVSARFFASRLLVSLEKPNPSLA